MSLSTRDLGSRPNQPGGSSATLRQQNSSRVLTAIRASQVPLRVAEIAKVTGLSRPTVETVTEGLLGQGWLLTAGLDSHSRGAQLLGRPARFFVFNERAAHVMGVDIGAHTVSVALADLKGNFIARTKTRVAPVMEADERLALAADAIASLLAQESVDRSNVLALTVGTPGTVSPVAPIVELSPGIPGWAHADVRAALSAVLGCDVTLENDANLAVLGEQARGVAVGATDVVFLLLGERLGAGIIANGALVRGRNGAAGELGYVPVPGAKKKDPRYGPLEAEVNASGLVDMGRATAVRYPSSALNTSDRLTAEDITTAASAGDAAALSVLHDLAAKIANGIAPGILALDPEMLVIGGGLSRGGEILRQVVADALAEVVLYAPRVLISALSDEAVLVGAVANSLERVRSDVLEHVSA